jgi:hypothetical protein
VNSRWASSSCEPATAAIRALPETAWQPALRQDGEVRKGAAVADAIHTAALPEGARLLVCREPLHLGAQQTFDNIDGYRFTALLTDQADADIVTLEQRHRARARAEGRIADLNDLSMAGLPCDDFDRNAVWLHLTLLAMNLLAWTRALTVDGELATARPKRLCYQLFHVPARIARIARRTTMRLTGTWPSTDQLLAAFARLRVLPPAPD